jgi:hypothetical protein
LLVIVESPWLFQGFPNAPTQNLLTVRSKALGTQGQAPPEVIEECTDNTNADIRWHPGQYGVSTPGPGIRTYLLEAVVVNAEKATLLQVRLNDAPAPSQVFVNPIFDKREEGLAISPAEMPVSARLPGVKILR